MQHLIPDRPPSSDGLDGSHPSASPSSPPRRGALSHRQARGRLALALDPTTQPELLQALQQHVAGCERCQQQLGGLRQAEEWFLAHPAEVAQMAAAQDTVWSAIQARIGANGAARAASNGHLNGHLPADKSATGAEIEREIRLAEPAPSLPVPMLPRVASRSRSITPMKALIAVLAASFLMSSLALLTVHLSSENSAQTSETHAPPIADILDPGNATLALGFDPSSRRLFTLTSDLRAACVAAQCTSADAWHAPAPNCLHLSSLAADTGARMWALLPACMQAQSSAGSAGATFTALFEDAALGQLALLDTAEQVTTINARNDALGTTYALACCTKPQTQTGQTWLDARDHLLLTATITTQSNTLETLAAQDMTTGQITYRTALDGSTLDGAVVSAATGWLYLWTNCASGAGTACVEAYEARNGQKVASWQTPQQSTPLAADPVDAVLYAREEIGGGSAATLALDGRSGALLGQLPSAQAMVINGLLHHAYLLNDTGVTVVDTRSRRKLSTLPVLAHDGALWATPVVDERYDRLYLPTMRGKVLTAQDDAAGHLRLTSPKLQATLDAERAVTNTWAADKLDLDPADLPIGPGAFTFTYPLAQTQPTGCRQAAVPARTQSSAIPLGGGDYSVSISLDWGDMSTQASTPQAVTSPPAQASYPHQHIWMYHIPASGGAKWASEQGEALPHC